MKVVPEGGLRARPSLRRRAAWTLLVVAAVLVGGSQGTQNAVANGDTRTLSLYHTHTKERLTVTFRRNGQYDERALEQLNWFLRDWRTDEATRMDPRLFDVVWATHREVGSSEAVHIVSAYRSPHTNSMLRRRSNGVAENSQHMNGKAMDFFLPDVPIERVRSVGMRLQWGGVGYYPTSYNPFVHLDVGSVRAWPRMTRDQLVRLFPDGKTVHLPADGTPLPGYEQARAEVLARGGTVAGVTAVASASVVPGGTTRKTLWATLFGGGANHDDEDRQEVQAQRTLARSSGATVTPAQPVASVPAPVRTASATVDSGEAFQRAFPPTPPRRPADAPAEALAFAPAPSGKSDIAPTKPAVAPAAVLASVAATIVPPLPPARPVERIQVASADLTDIALPAPRTAPAAPRLSQEGNSGVRALFARSLSVATPGLEPRGLGPVPPGALGTAGPTLALSFSAQHAGDLIDGRFSGPAVRPVPVLR